MLVISRKAGESLVISEDIKITILSVAGDRVAVGIEAPKSVRVAREELLETIRANRDAVSHAGNQNYAGIALMLKNNKSSKNI